MSKWAFNYESGEYEDIDKDGFSWTRGEYRIDGTVLINRDIFDDYLE